MPAPHSSPQRWTLLFPILLLSTRLAAQAAPPCVLGPADEKRIRVDATVAAPLATVYQLGDSVLRAHGYHWTSAGAVAERVTAPRFTWPEGTESEPWHGAQSPGLVIMFSAFTAHDSTRLSISSQVVCRVSPPEVEPTDSSVESQLRVLGAVEVVSGLSDALRRYRAVTAP